MISCTWQNNWNQNIQHIIGNTAAKAPITGCYIKIKPNIDNKLIQRIQKETFL